MTWSRVPLAEVADFTLGKMLDANKNRGADRPYLANVNVRWGEFDLSDLRTMRFEESESERFGVRDGDILMCEGGEPGRCAVWRDQLPGMMYQKALHRIRVKESTDPRFLYYTFVKMGRTGEFAQFFTGATIKHLPKEKLALVHVPLPEEETQRRIADILAAYDDLIENNRRRIQLLEEAARLLYRGWFVRLRFPEYAHSEVRSGVPDGWVRQPIEEALDSHIGGGWGQDDPQNDEIEPAYVIRGTDFPALTIGQFQKVGLRFHKPGPLSKRILHPGDIIFEVSGGSATQPIARSVFVSDKLLGAFKAPVICASFCKKFVARNLHQGLFLHLTFQEDRRNGRLLVYQKQSASALLNYNFAAFLTGYHVLIPPDQVLADFFDLVMPLVDQATTLALQNQRLQVSRDLLLPRLMSGEVEV